MLVEVQVGKKFNTELTSTQSIKNIETIKKKIISNEFSTACLLSKLNGDFYAGRIKNKYYLP